MYHYRYIYVDNCVDPEPEHLHVSEIEKWLSGVNDVEGYEKFKIQMKDILENDNSILFGDGVQAKIKEDGELQLNCNGEQREINDEELCSFWNYIRDVGIVSENDIPSEYEFFSNVLLTLMKKLEYVQSVIVSEDGTSFSKKANAYQFVAE